MNKFEFVSYDPTPGEKHLGIVTITYLGKMILRYKIMPNKEGKGFYPLMASYKVGERYEIAFELDSNIEKNDLKTFICKKVDEAIASVVHIVPKVESCGVIEELPF